MKSSTEYSLGGILVLTENQTWAFNYVTSEEDFTNMANLSTTVYIWEAENLTMGDIRDQVEALIDSTIV